MYGLYALVMVPSGQMEGPTIAAREKLTQLGLTSPVMLIGVAIFYSLIHSGLEEYYWRWFVYKGLAGEVSQPIAITVSALGFMAHHVLVLARYFTWTNPWTYGLSICIAVGGVLWAMLYHRYRTILGPWLSHMLVDAAIFAIGFQMIYL